MREMRMQIQSPQWLLTLGVVFLMATLVLGSPQNLTSESGEPGRMLDEPISEAPAQRFDRSC